MAGIAEAILELVESNGGSVSFAELSRQIPGFNGDMELAINNDRASNILLWSGVSVEAANALDELRAAGAIHARPASLLVYLIDGAAPRLPVAQRPRHYKKPHWAPTVFYPGPEAPEPKRRSTCADRAKVTTLPARLDLAAMTAGDLRAQFEPIQLCPFGFNNIVEKCAEDWDGCTTKSETGKDLVRQVRRAAEWLTLCGMVKSINRDSTSYGLKHQAERWCRDQGHPHGGYICNGALLMAAYGLGFTVCRPSVTCNFPNAYINISRRRPEAQS